MSIETKASDTLTAAKALIATPQQWTQHVYARNAHGHEAKIYDTAVCYCALGAILCVTPETKSRIDARFFLRRALLRRALAPDETFDEACISKWNDAPERTHAEVMAGFDKAIVLARTEDR